jgi:serine/threonine protein kinase
MKTCPICEKSWPSNHANCPTDGALLIDLRELEPGTIIRGKYRIVRQLGRGGMGTVYLAEHILLNRPRALKFISGELSQNATFLRRFRREAQAAIELRHPNIVEVVDLDQAEDGSPYIAMEYVEGPDLRHALQSGAFPVERTLHIARGIALGLGAAHAKGIVHRDVKPENILLAGGNNAPETPKLLDFGIAAMKESVTVASSTHGLLLTPPYAAPEQWKGMAAEELDGRADLYALGGVLYEMLTGKTCFHAHNTEGWMYQHLQEQPQPPSQLRPELANWLGLEPLVLRLLAKDREQRPRDAGELFGLLDTVRYVAPSARKETVWEDIKLPERHGTIPEIVFSGGGQPDVREERPPEQEPELKSFLQYGDQPEAGEGGHPRRSWNSLGGWGLLAVALALAVYGAVHFFGPQKSTQPGTSSTPSTTETQQPASGTNLKPPSTSPEIAEINQQAETLFKQKRYTKARPLLEQACAGGFADACNNLGEDYWEGFSVTRDDRRAVTLFSKACDAGNTEGCTHLGVMYVNRGTSPGQNYSRARALFTKACDAGNAEGCIELGILFDDGSGVPANHAQAQSLYSRAAALYAKDCASGDIGKCFELGHCYDGSNEVMTDYPKALAPLIKVCNTGSADGCESLGALYENDYYEAKDPSQSKAFYARAVPLYSRACASGDAGACFNLAMQYENGKGVQTDKEKARQLYSKACSLGYPNGCTTLKQMQ